MLVLVGDEIKSPVQGWRYVSVGFLSQVLLLMLHRDFSPCSVLDGEGN